MVQLTGDQTAGVDFELLRTYPWCVAMNAAFLGRSSRRETSLLESSPAPTSMGAIFQASVTSPSRSQAVSASSESLSSIE